MLAEEIIDGDEGGQALVLVNGADLDTGYMGSRVDPHEVFLADGVNPIPEPRKEGNAAAEFDGPAIRRVDPLPHQLDLHDPDFRPVVRAGHVRNVQASDHAEYHGFRRRHFHQRTDLKIIVTMGGLPRRPHGQAGDQTRARHRHYLADQLPFIDGNGGPNRRPGGPALGGPTGLVDIVSIGHGSTTHLRITGTIREHPGDKETSTRVMVFSHRRFVHLGNGGAPEPSRGTGAKPLMAAKCCSILSGDYL